MTEIKDCLPESVRKHFIDLRNIRLEAETAKYRERLVKLRAQIATRNQGRSGWQEMEEWKYKEELSDALATGYVQDALETCQLYDIPLTQSICDCLVKAVEELLEIQYRNALRTQAQGMADVNVPLSVRQQGNLRSKKIMPQIRVMIESARVADEKKRVAIGNASRMKEPAGIHIHNTNITTVDEVKSEDTKEKARWSRNDKIGVATLVVISIHPVHK